jgi:hypothetical protein
MKNDLSAHANKRKSQRAITDFHLSLLKFYGVSTEQKGGTYVLSLDEKTCCWLRNQLENELARWDHLQSTYAVCSETGVIITTGHRMKHKKKGFQSTSNSRMNFMARPRSNKVTIASSGNPYV